MRTFIVTLMLTLSACKTVHDKYSLAAMKPVEQSYAQLASSHINAAETHLVTELDRFLVEEEVDSQDLIVALKDWEETLSFFAHVFPCEADEDRYLNLLDSATFGLFLMRETKRSHHQVDWAKSAYYELTSIAMQNYLRDLNQQYASRRKNNLMPRAYWFGVNFIPDLGGSFTSNLKDYLKAQKKALADDIARASDGDPLFPGQNVLLQNVRDRSEALLRLEEKFLAVDESFTYKNEIIAIHRSYSAILDDLDRYTSYIDAKDDAKASILGKQIRKDWETEKQRFRSSAKS